jgi:hypothetical protein
MPVEGPRIESLHPMPLLLLFLLIAGCASPGSELRRGTLAPPPPPPVRPGHGAPQVGQPGLQPQEYPRSPHRRVLPPTREPGLWAGDEPQASRLGPQAAPQREALRAADEAARPDADAKGEESASVEASAEASGEPPNCKGQNHHIISRPIAEALGRHETLRGLYEPRDRRFVAKAKDKDSHCGYQDWHRRVDEEVIDWLRQYRKATPQQFMKKLREIYNRPDMLKRFPNGF